jgi:hypothetical protein
MPSEHGLDFAAGRMGRFGYVIAPAMMSSAMVSSS